MQCGLSYTGELVGNHVTGTGSRRKICFEHMLNRRRPATRGLHQHLLYCTWNAEEGYTPFEEGCDGDLVGGVERDAGIAAGLGRLVGESQAGESSKVGG